MASISEQFERALLLHQQGDLTAAAAGYEGVLAADADHPEALHLLGLIAHQSGRPQDAERLMRRSIELSPGEPSFHNNFAIVCMALAKPADAERHLRRAVELQPDYVDAWLNLARVLEGSGRTEEACVALASSPGVPAILNHLGRLHVQCGRRAEAAAVWRQSLQLAPDAETASNLSAALVDLGKLTDAIAAAEVSIRLDPKRAQPRVNLGAALSLLGRQREAVAAYRAALQIDPNRADAWSNLALALDANQLPEAVAAAEKAVALRPDRAESLTTMGQVRRREGRLDEAIDLWRRALAVSPRHADALNNLAGVLLERGEVAEAIEAYRETIAANPNHSGGHSNLLLALHYDHTQSPQTIAEAHRDFGRRFGQSAVARGSFERSRDPERRIKVGYVSPYFRTHAVATFLTGIFAHHDRSKFEITCYSDVRPDEIDSTSATIRAAVDHWIEIGGMLDQELIALVRSRNEHILVDVTGHIARNRMSAFAQRMAPIQVTYIGYQNTTGLPAMDYRLTDRAADPPGESDSRYVERLERLPRFFVYSPPANAPAVSELPALRNGYVTFGSLNNPAKHNEKVIALWAQLMHRVPDSRIMLLVNGPGESERRFTSAFAAHGIAAERIRLMVRGDSQNYLQAYGEIDIALDPTPFSGHTTTCDALWMGVPVITLAGATYGSRMTTSVLTHLPMPQWIAADEKGYLDQAAALAADLPGLAKVRAGLRPIMEKSAITDAAGFTADLENAYRRMWADWCTSTQS